jgi:3-hydroxyisobutyrate dehydrogenase-like beta-hydroxyacid dehydrogenase
MTRTTRVGFVGLGTLGLPMSLNLRHAGFPLAVRDVRPEPLAELAALGARVCGSPAEVMQHADVVVSLVQTLEQTREVVLGQGGIVEAAARGKTLIVGSTIGPAAMIELARAVQATGCAFVDGAVTGGYPAARAGSLTVIVAADDPTLDAVEPVLQVFGKTIIRTGPVGNAQRAKLVNNMVLSANIVALLEGLALGAAAGLDPAVLRRTLRSATADSYPLQVWEELGGRWKGQLGRRRAGDPVPNLSKDLQLALALAHELAIPMPVAAQAAALFEGGAATGHDDARL